MDVVLNMKSGLKESPAGDPGENEKDADIPSFRTIEVECKECQKIITCDVPVKDREYYPFSYVFNHGQPVHALVIYIDSNYKVRGVEIAKEVGGIGQSPEMQVVPLMNELDKSLAAKRAKDIWALSREISEILWKQV